jgi:hypothetical protein
LRPLHGSTRVPSPAGNGETAVREILDLVGKARRAKGTNLTADEVRAKTSANTATDITANAYSLFFTTGRIATSHLANLAAGPKSDDDNVFDVDRFLRRTNITFTATSDGLLGRLGHPDHALILFYPDSLRVQIADLLGTAGERRFSLDLRRMDNRAVAVGPHSEDVLSAQVLRGVVEGTLERSLTEYAIGSASNTSQLANS